MRRPTLWINISKFIFQSKKGFFGPRVPVDNLEVNLVAINYFKMQDRFDFKEVVVVSPDAGGV